VVRLQGPPFRKLSGHLDELSTYQLKIHLWLCRFAVVQGDPEEDPEKHTALVSEHLGPVISSLASHSRCFGFKSQPIHSCSCRGAVLFSSVHTCRCWCSTLKQVMTASFLASNQVG
jgi:hypothetical protein